MKMPWTNKTGLPKVATILATILLISLSLCGANFVAVIRFVSFSDPAPGTPTWPETLLTITAKIEIAAICLSIFGLILVGVSYAADASTQRIFSSTDKSPKDTPKDTATGDDLKHPDATNSPVALNDDTKDR